MGKHIKHFVQDFQDNYILKRNTINEFPAELTSIEVNLLDKQMDSLQKLMGNLSDMTLMASKENLQDYNNLLVKIEDKIEYISSLSDMLLYINSFYDMSNVKEVFNYNLISDVNNSSLVYNKKFKGVTLSGHSNNYQCSHSAFKGNTVTYYNTNSSYHSGISLESPFLDLLKIKTIFIRKADGTVLNLEIHSFNKGVEYLHHDFITSTQIVVEFEENISNLPQEQQEYYKTLNISLIDFKYNPSGNVVLESHTYSRVDTLSFIFQYELPPKCFINMDLNLILKDVNSNLIDTISITLPVGLPKVCKPLDQINFNQVGNIDGVYMNNEYTSDFDIESLKTYQNRNEIYVVYYPKIEDTEVLNKNIKVLNNQGILVINKNVRNIEVSSTISMHSFSKNNSPNLKMIAGVAKYG